MFFAMLYPLVISLSTTGDTPVIKVLATLLPTDSDLTTLNSVFNGVHCVIAVNWDGRR